MQPVLVIYTGGTIGMEKAADGTYQPTGGFEQLAKQTVAPAIWAQMPAHDYLEISPAIDSADMTPVHWRLIAETIITHYDHYSGFIVLHGTDTMAYTASMLSFLLGGLDKTVILTGSQIPLIEPCSDGANNLLVSLQLVAESRVPEVCIYFANQLFRGNRATKISTSAMIAFESANYPILAAFENQLKLFHRRWRAPEAPTFANSKLPVFKNGQVGVVYLTPGMPFDLMRAAVDSTARGLVLVSYGSGNVPSSNAELTASLETAKQKGIIIVNVSQCAGGHVSGSYAAAKPLQNAGVISGEDMTIEAAVTKLYYLLAQHGDDSQTIKQQLVCDLRGELTPSNAEKYHQPVTEALSDKNTLAKLKRQVCFVGGTLVHTDKGLIPIKDIKVGDLVLSKPENGEGDLVYKPVLRTIVTEDMPVYFSTFTPESVEELPFHQRSDLSLYADVLCTANHPFWVVGKGWVEAQQLQLDDDVLLKDGETAFCESYGFDGEGIEMVFKTDDPKVGYVPDFAEQTNDGRFVDLTTGRTLRYGGYTPVFNKLFVQDTEWKQRLLAQLPAVLRAGAYFFGFRTGFRQDSAGIDWATGEGPVTTTVYNIEVADTHTYFVGEQGVWVHNCGRK